VPPKVKSARGGLNDGLFREVIDDFIQDGHRSCVNIIEFTEAPWGLNFHLTPVQRFMLKCFYGIELSDRDPDIIIPDVLNSKKLHGPMTEVEFAQWSYEEKRCNYDFSVPNAMDRSFYELQLVLGRRSGKSTLCAIIIDYEFYKLCSLGNPHTYYNVPPGQEIAVVGTAPTDEQSGIIFDFAMIFSQKSPLMRDRLTHETQSYFQIQTDDDIATYGRGRQKRGSIQFITGGSSSNAIRGHNAIAIVFDEMAFFVENAGRFSIDEVYTALTPSISKFSSPTRINKLTGNKCMDSKILCISSPYAHFGKFYNLYREAFSEEGRELGQRLVFRYYSALVNPENAPEDYLREQRRQDRGKFRREFEAEFDERITSWIDSETAFRSNVRRPYQDVSGRPGVRYFWGFDLGVTDNGTAIAVVHKDEERYALDYAEVFYSSVSPIWEASLCTVYNEHPECARWRQHPMIPLFDVAVFVRELSKKYPMYRALIDQFSGHAFYQILNSNGVSGVVLTAINEAIKCQVYQLFKDLYTEGLLDLMDHPVLIPEMLNLEAELRPQGRVVVGKRSSTDGSFQDDISDAVVRAVWDCWRFHNVESGPSSARKIPSVVSFGNGRVFDGTGNALSTSQRLLRTRTINEYQVIKRKIHGTVPTRKPQMKGTPYA
jgi:phage terminase large subunit-like protein